MRHQWVPHWLEQCNYLGPFHCRSRLSVRRYQGFSPVHTVSGRAKPGLEAVVTYIFGVGSLFTRSKVVIIRFCAPKLQHTKVGSQQQMKSRFVGI